MEGILQLPYVQNLIQQYGIDKALELLGLDQEENNPLIFGMPDSLPFGPKKFNLLPTIARTGFNAALKGGLSISPLLLGAGIMGLGYYRNPLREGSPNYNPNLQGQIDYLSANNLIGTDIGPGQGFTRYGPASVLQGKNVVSGFGTNDYRTMLENYIDKMEANKKISAVGKARKLRKARKELFNLDTALAKKEVAEEASEVSYQGAGDGASQANKGSSVGYTAADDRRESFRGRYGQGGLASLV